MALPPEERNYRGKVNAAVRDGGWNATHSFPPAAICDRPVSAA